MCRLRIAGICSNNSEFIIPSLDFLFCKRHVIFRAQSCTQITKHPSRNTPHSPTIKGFSCCSQLGKGFFWCVLEVCWNSLRKPRTPPPQNLTLMTKIGILYLEGDAFHPNHHTGWISMNFGCVILPIPPDQNQVESMTLDTRLRAAPRTHLSAMPQAVATMQAWAISEVLCWPATPLVRYTYLHGYPP